ncbi:Mur ligase family protein, partial [Vibrio sp. 1403]|uniref:Mur ligase family protein n=1 Tax=Vibrio sp. 1403 TaxID=3074555 RepID=UPI00296671A8
TSSLKLKAAAFLNLSEEMTSSLKLKAAAFLNLSEDHMDRYEGMADYRAAKLRIFDHAELAVVNRDDQETYPEVEMPVVTFGSDEQAYGLEVDGSRTWLLDHGQRVIASDELKLVGKHNLANALVVLALLKAAGVDYHNALNALKNYTGLTHRCQVVADNRGVKWVNDSKATNIASTIAALSGLESTG